MDKHIFVKLLRLAREKLFLHKDCLYKQIDGVAIRSPLGSTLTNFFLARMETKILDSNCLCQPKSYARFVDDCFAVFNNDSSFLDFFSLLNAHNDMKFTVESALQCISFLDVRIMFNNDNTDTLI